VLGAGLGYLGKGGLQAEVLCHAPEGLGGPAGARGRAAYERSILQSLLLRWGPRADRRHATKEEHSLRLHIQEPMAGTAGGISRGLQPAVVEGACRRSMQRSVQGMGLTGGNGLL